MSETDGGWSRNRKTVQLLSEPGFRRLFTAGTVSRTGDAVYFVAATWLVFDLTGSTSFTGVAAASFRLPAVASVFLGPLVDRAPLDGLLPAAEVAQGLVVTLVPLAAAVGRLSAPLTLAVVVVVATLGRVGAPATQAALPRLVDEESLARANSVYSSTRQALGALAESVAGTLIALVGAVALFVADAATFAVAGAVYAALRIPSAAESDDSSGAAETGIPTFFEYLTDIREGMATIRGSFLRDALGGAMLASLGTELSTAVLPAFGDAVGGAQAYGLLITATTAGTLIGSLVAARFEDRPFGLVVVGGFLVAAVGRLVAVTVQTSVLVFIAFGAAAVPLGVYDVLVSTVVQAGVPNRLMARVSSTSGTLPAVVGPVGLLLGGALGTRLDAAIVVGLSAGGTSRWPLTGLSFRACGRSPR